ncbi:hypothetical protein [Marinobacter arenosus]|uniref:hypothetical protein n=1 Tax=Marinobacter arenosus TaxID=2856822 RepID=UPI001C4D3CC5|nr:hypothetical protein [Marinobacter arenosus]MBW0145873.1 hypothetical protein [Marinobacter arenosus]
MKLFQKKLDTESLSALKLLSESCVQFLYSPYAHVDFGSSIITVQHISIQIGSKQYLIIENDWADTPKEAHDYYFLGARISDRPKDVTVRESKDGRRWTYIMDHFSFHLGKRKRVVSVEVMEDSFIGEEESVRYDAGIVITFEDSSKVSIVREESITGALRIAALQKENNDLIADLKPRVRYSA